MKADGTVDMDGLIGQLARTAEPVKRLPRPSVEAAALLAGAALLGTLAVMLFARTADFTGRMNDPMQAAAFAGALTTGTLALIAACHRARPDRPARWTLLPLPALALWLGASGLGCLAHWGEAVPDEGGPWIIGASRICLLFILGLGIPAGIVLLLALRRARPLDPGPVALLAGLAAAALSAALLAFFHPFDITLLDFAVHAVAVLLVIGLLRANRLLSS